MKSIILLLLLSSISPPPMIKREVKPLPPLEFKYHSFLQPKEPEHPFVLIPDPCPWLRKDYIQPSYLDEYYKKIIPDWKVPEKQQYYKKVPWPPQNLNQ